MFVLVLLSTGSFEGVWLSTGENGGFFARKERSVWAAKKGEGKRVKKKKNQLHIASCAPRARVRKV